MDWFFDEYVKNEIEKVLQIIERSGLFYELVDIVKKSNKKSQAKKSLKKKMEEFKTDDISVVREMDLFFEIYSVFPGAIFHKEDPLYKKTDPLNIVLLIILSEGSITEEDVFEDWRVFQSDLWEKGYKEIASYLEFNNISKVYDLIDIYGN